MKASAVMISKAVMPGVASMAARLAFNSIHQLALGDQPAIHADALSEGVQVRRGVQPRAIAGRAQHRFHHGRRRAFAFRAGDVHGAELVLRTAQLLQQIHHAAQVERLRVVTIARLALVVDVIENIVQGVLIKAHVPDALLIRCGFSDPMRSLHSSARGAK